MTKPLSPEVLVYSFDNAADPQISPDGTRILYTLSKAHKEKDKRGSNIWICDIDGGNKRQLTWSGKANGNAIWSPDGTQIAFVSDRAGEKKSGIYLMSAVNGGDARELTTHNQGISGLTWSPNGKNIAYISNYDPENPDEAQPDKDAPPKVRVTRRIDYKQDGKGWVGEKRPHIWVVNVDSGEKRRLTEAAVDHAGPNWSPDSATLAVQVGNRNGMCSQLGLIDVASGSMKLIGPELGTIDSFAWSPDGKRIAFSGDESVTWQSDFFIYDVDGGEVKRLTDDLQQLPMPAVFGGGQPIWLDDRQVLFSAIRAGASGLHVIDAENGSVEPIADWKATHMGLSTDDAKRYVVQGHTDMTSLGNIHVYDMQSNEGKLITNYNEEVLKEHQPADWERFEIERNGYPIEYWMLKPPGFDPSKKYPAVLEIHGGPNGFFGYSFQPIHQLLATNGFVVVFANPRGSSSYGREFTQQVAEDWGGEDYLDLMAVMDKALEDHPFIDPARTGCSGYSYGGYMTSWIIGQTDRFAACVCGAPCFDLQSMYGTSDISHHFGELQWGGEPHESVDWYRAHSPASFAQNATTPTLIICGEADDRCPIGQAEQMFVALLKAGVDTEFARYPGGAHGFRRMGPPEHIEDCWERTLAWFKEYLGDPK